jgi:DNA-binding response OmpR family regulator
MMNKRVLLIDDDRDDAEIFSDALAEAEITSELDYFDDGAKAMETLLNKATLPDIIFLDINMPSVSGWECLREIKKLAALQHIPIVMYSTSNLQSEGISAADIGAAAFLTKPDNFRDLKNKLSNLFNDLFKSGSSTA